MKPEKLMLSKRYVVSFLLCTISILNAQTERIVIELPESGGQRSVLSLEEQSNIQAQEHEINQFVQDLNLNSHPDYYILNLIKPRRKRSARTLAINPAGTMLAAGYWSSRNGLVCYDVTQDGTLIEHKFRNSSWETVADQFVTALAFSHDGKKLASGGWKITVDGLIWPIFIWSFRTKNSEALEGHTDVVKDVAFNHTGTLLASTSDDYRLRLWDLTTFKLQGEYRWEQNKGEAKWGYSVSFNSTDRLLSVSQEDGIVKIFEVDKFFGDENTPVIEISFKQTGGKNSFTKRIAIARFSPQEPLLLALTLDNYCVLLDLATHTYRFLSCLQQEHFPPFRALRFNQTGDLIATRDENGIIYCWHVHDRNCAGIGLVKWFWNHTAYYEDLVFLPNDYIITSGEITNQWIPKLAKEINASAYLIVLKKLFSPGLYLDEYFKNRADRFKALQKYFTPAAVNEYFENQESVKSEPLSPSAIRAEEEVPMKEADQQKQIASPKVVTQEVEIAIEQPAPVPSSAEAHIPEEKSTEAGYVTKFKNLMVNALQQTWNMFRSASHAGYRWIRNKFS